MRITLKRLSSNLTPTTFDLLPLIQRIAIKESHTTMAIVGGVRGALTVIWGSVVCMIMRSASILIQH